MALNLGTKKVMLGDYIDNGNIKHKRKQFVLIGQGDTAFTHNGNSIFLLSNSEIKDGSEIPSLCNYYTRTELAVSSMPDKTFKVAKYSNVMRIIIKDTSYSSTSTFNDYLKSLYDNNVPVIVETELAEEETESLTAEQQAQVEAINKMQSYSGTTIITSTYAEGNAQMIINGSALKECS